MKKSLLAAAVALGLTLVVSPPAYAADGLTEAKRAVTVRIDGRLATLRVLTTAVNEAKRLTPSHKSTLTNLLGADTDGLTALKAKVAGETTVAAVREDATKMVNDYRIYLLVVPKVHLAHALDLEAASIDALRQAYDKLSAAVAAAKGAGKDVGDADAKLADLNAQLTAASSAIGGKADVLLAIQPGPDAAAIRAALAPVRESARTGRESLRKALDDARTVRDILKGLK